MFVFHYIPQIKHLIIGLRSSAPRCPSQKIDLGRGVPGQNSFGPKLTGTPQTTKGFETDHTSVNVDHFIIFYKIDV